MSATERAEVSPISIGHWGEENPHEPVSHSAARVVGGLALGGLLLGTGMVAGAWTAVSEVPIDTSLAPGLSISTTLHHESQSEINFGAAGVLDVPKVHKKVGVLGDFAAHIRVDPINIDSSSKFDNAAALVNDPAKSIIEPVMTAEGIRALQGGIVGMSLGLGTALAIGNLRRMRQLKRTEKEAELEMDEAVAQLPAEFTKDGKVMPAWTKMRETSEALIKPRRFRKLLALGAAATALAGVFGPPLLIPHSGGNANEAAAIPLDPSLTRHVPLLNGATVKDSGGLAVNKGAHKVGQIIEQADASWHHAASLLPQKVDRFRRAGGMEWQKDPSITPVLVVTDIHCNQPYMREFLPELIKEFGINTVANLGDQYNFGNTGPLDADCMSTYAEVLKPDNLEGRSVTTAFVRGNHDPAKLPAEFTNLRYKNPNGSIYQPIVQLDERNHFIATINGVTFAGNSDRNVTTMNGTTPSDFDAQMKNDAAEGRQLTKVIYGFGAANGWERPIVLAHEPEVADEPLASGDAAATESGHLHETQPNLSYQSASGASTIRQVTGSASGAGPENFHTIYSNPTAMAAARVLLVDTRTNEPRGSILITYSPSEQLKIKTENFPHSHPNTTATAEVNRFRHQHVALR